MYKYYYTTLLQEFMQNRIYFDPKYQSKYPIVYLAVSFFCILLYTF